MKTYIFLATAVVLTTYSSPVPNPKPQIHNNDFFLTILKIVMALSANKITMEVEDTTIMEEEEVKEEMEVEDLEMVEEEEAMVPKIAKILNVNKSILREELEEVQLEETNKTAKTPNVNRLLMEKITATSSQMTFLTEEETGDTEDIDDVIFIFSSNRNKLFK